MTLKYEDFQSTTWKRFSKLLQERLQELRELNDAPSFSPEKTAAIRGSIAEVKRILALADEANARDAAVPSLTGDSIPAEWPNQ